ncbi:hypothetical protein BD779DRAFT_1793882 [Infundibulicybe gibba]|nr:hypothetical protein BD779DRAFT_1793882 [Infundibulicybe gibba]
MAHVAWADKLERLAKAVPDSANLLLPATIKKMPKALKTVIGTNFKTWKEFCEAVRDASVPGIKDAQEDQEELRAMKETIQRMEQADKSGKSIRDIMRTVTFNQPTTAIRPTTPLTPNSSIIPNQIRPIQSFRPEADRYVDVTTKALQQHPNTPAWRELYERQISDWTSKHGMAGPTELRPYPLTPGTTPVASGECWKCGRPGHCGMDCTQPQVPTLEQKWRSIASSIWRRAEAIAAPVNVIAEFDEEETKVITRFLERMALEPGKVRKNSVPFVHGVELEGPNGEIVRIRSVFDDGAMVNAIDKKLHTKIKERLTMAKPSSKVLHMADGRLVPSAGIWEGGVTVAGIKNQGRFEIFDSGGAWGLLFGKPLLQAFKAQHDYEKDTIQVRQTDGMEAILKNQYRVLPATHPPGSLIGLTTDIKQTISLEGDQCLSPVRQVPHRKQSGIDDPSEGADTSEEASSRVASDTQEVEEGANNGQRGNSEPARTNSVGESRSPSREVLNETQPVHLANVVDTLVTTDIPDNIWIVCEDGTGVNDDPGTEQPVMPTKLSPSVLTRASDPFNTKRVDAVMKEITIGPDVVGEEREAVVQLLREHADCFALSLSEVTPVKGASTS